MLRCQGRQFGIEPLVCSELGNQKTLRRASKGFVIHLAKALIDAAIGKSSREVK